MVLGGLAQYSTSGIGSSATVSQNQIAPYSDQHFSIRTEQFRYIYYRNGEEELYDHHLDPNEWNKQQHQMNIRIL